MNKKQYQHPTMCVVRMMHQTQLLSSSITDVNGNDTGIGYGGGGSGSARAPQRSGWDE